MASPSMFPCVGEPCAERQQQDDARGECDQDPHTGFDRSIERSRSIEVTAVMPPRLNGDQKDFDEQGEA